MSSNPKNKKIISSSVPQFSVGGGNSSFVPLTGTKKIEGETTINNSSTPSSIRASQIKIGDDGVIDIEGGTINVKCQSDGVGGVFNIDAKLGSVNIGTSGSASNAIFNTTSNTFNQPVKINKIDGSGDVLIEFQQGGTTTHTMGIDDSSTGNLFKIHSGTSLVDTSDFTMDSSGNVTLNGDLDVSGDITAFSSSDKRLKTNIQQIPNSLEKVNKLGGYTFEWIPVEGVHSNDGCDVGVIAQELQEVLPEIVITRDNGYKAVRYEKITPLLIEGIKEQHNQIQLQEEKINYLEEQFKKQQEQITLLFDLCQKKLI